MQLPLITQDQILERCTEQSFDRGLAYYNDGMIGNPVLQGYTLSANCQGTEDIPYAVSVELMPTGIATTHCSCPYDWDGDCKHIVALLLTYRHDPDLICSVDALLAELEAKPKSNLLHVISELLKRAPELAPIAQILTDIHEAPPCPDQLLFVEVYKERIDYIFGNSFLEQHKLRNVLIQLERLVQHAESLVKLGETDFALVILHALIHQSIVRYPDTLQKDELPRFVKECTKTFAQITSDTQQFSEIPTHCSMLLQLSFEVEKVFVPILTHLLEQLCLTQDTVDLQATIERRLDESLDRQAHVQLLLAEYHRAGQTEDYLNLARCEGEGYRLIHALFTHQHDTAAWKAIEEFSLSANEYVGLLRSPFAERTPEFTNKLLVLLRYHNPDIAVMLYQDIIEQKTLKRRRENYENVSDYLSELKTLYCSLDQENEWTVYLAGFRERHSSKRVLLQLISDI